MSLGLSTTSHRGLNVYMRCPARCPLNRHLLYRHRCFRSLNLNATSGSLDPESGSILPKEAVSGPEHAPEEKGPEPWWKRFTTFDKSKLATLGFGAFCAYGVISNVNAGILITIAWLTVVKTQGAMPIAPGMWPKFLAVYAGLWVTSHFMRPIRLSLAIAAAPFFEKAIAKIMEWTGMKNKVLAFGIMLVIIALGTIASLALTIFACGGFIF